MVIVTVKSAVTDLIKEPKNIRQITKYNSYILQILLLYCIALIG